MELTYPSISIATTYSKDQFTKLGNFQRLHLFNQLLAQQLSIYVDRQNKFPTLKSASFKDVYKLLKLFNARLVELGLVHGNLFELVMDDYKHDFDLLLKNPYFINNHDLYNSTVSKALKDEHLFYREGDFLYRTSAIDRFALSDFLDLVEHFHIGLVPNMMPINSLNIMFDLEFDNGVVHLVRNPKLNEIEEFPLNCHKNESLLDIYKGWARFNVGKIAFVMPYPKEINISSLEVATSHFRKDCAQYKRYLELIENLQVDWEILRNNNEITLCRVMVDLLSNMASRCIKEFLSEDDINCRNAHMQIQAFLSERKSKFSNLQLPNFYLQEFFEWGDLNANLRWVLSHNDKYLKLDQSERLKLIECIDLNQFGINDFKNLI